MRMIHGSKGLERRCGFDPKGLEADAEPPMNPRGGQGLVKDRFTYDDVDQNPFQNSNYTYASRL